MNKLFDSAAKFFLEKAVSFLANHGIKSGDLKFKSVDMVINWVVDQNSTNKEGWQKLEYVMSQFNSEFANRASWVVRTVVQLAYAIAKLRKII